MTQQDLENFVEWLMDTYGVELWSGGQEPDDPEVVANAYLWWSDQ